MCQFTAPINLLVNRNKDLLLFTQRRIETSISTLPGSRQHYASAVLRYGCPFISPLQNLRKQIGFAIAILYSHATLHCFIYSYQFRRSRLACSAFFAYRSRAIINLPTDFTRYFMSFDFQLKMLLVDFLGKKMQ